VGGGGFKPVPFFLFLLLCRAPWRTSTRHTARPPELEVATNRLLLFLAALQADAPPTLLLQPPLSCYEPPRFFCFPFLFYLPKKIGILLPFYFSNVSGGFRRHQIDSSPFCLINFEMKSINCGFIGRHLRNGQLSMEESLAI